jgi:hypothetical protein
VATSLELLTPEPESGLGLAKEPEIVPRENNVPTLADPCRRHVNCPAQVASNNVDMYLADHDLWVPMAPMPEPRFRFDAAYANGFT